jgi:glucosamine--fructose-6-phosphate aminotransferase (isomerizing)
MSLKSWGHDGQGGFLPQTKKDNLENAAEVMRSEIMEQPEVCARLLEREAPRLQGLLRRLKKNPPKGVVLAARGSSDHAATYGRYLLEYLTGIPTHLAAPSLVTLYRRKPDFRGYLVIGVSQSGQGPDVNAVMALARRQGALTLGLTNDRGSGLARASAHVLDLGAEKERSVAATKTFSAELAGLALLGVLWSGTKKMARELWQVPAQMEKVLMASQDPARAVAARLKKLESCAVLGRGFQMGVAHEIGLKMKECAGVPALSYSVADFAHGPISLAKGGFPVFLVSAPGKMGQETRATAADLRKRGAWVCQVGLGENPAGGGPGLLCDEPADEVLAPLLTILPGQWLAFHLALAKGLNPALPQGLKKITKTL